MDLLRALPALLLLSVCLLAGSAASAQGLGGAGAAGLPASIEVDDGFAREFIADYQTADANRIGKWLHPRRGVIDSRALKTRDQFLASLPQLAQVIKGSKITYRFGAGEFNGPNFYKALYPQSGGQIGDLRASISLICAFERIEGRWYLVQAHRHDAGSAGWYMVGDKITDERLSGPTLTGRRFSVSYATGRNHAVLLSFYDDRQDLFRDDNLLSFRTVKKWYDELKAQPIYVMTISERGRVATEQFMREKKLVTPVILDEQSEWHRALQVDQHPYLVLIDHNGVLRALHRAEFNGPAYTLFRQIVSDVLAQTPAKSSGQNSGPKPVDPSSKF